jgi:hypothetical protein
MSQHRTAIYVTLVVGFSLLTLVGAAVGGSDRPPVAYLCMLFALCACPVAFAERANGPYTMLLVFLSVYFLYFGGADLLDVWFGARTLASPTRGVAEAAILLGGALMVGGYLSAVRSRRATSEVARDWRASTVVIAGIAVWAMGAYSTWTWQVEILRGAWERIQGLGAAEAMLVTLGRMVHPLGLALLAYGAVKSRSKMFGLIVLGVICIEFVLGFIEDSKELAFRGAAIVLVAKYLLDGRVPKTWLVAACAVAVVAFPVFQAYRTDVLAVQKVSRGEAAQNLRKNVQTALDAQGRRDDVEFTSRSLLSRVSYKPMMEMILERTGKTAPFQNGYTLGLFFSSFVPRIFWPDKPDLSIGQIFNRSLHITDAGDTYISATILGELYWNFGWSGILLGMPLLGLLLGFINRRCDLSADASVSRFLVFVATVYVFCLRFEDGIAMDLTIWLRTLASIAVLHLFFGRRVASTESRANQEPDRAHLPEVAFPNLMR